MLEAARAALPELPAARAERYERDWALSADTARLLAFRPELATFFERGDRRRRRGPRASWVKDELVARLQAEADPAASDVSPQAVAKLVPGSCERQRHAAARAPCSSGSSSAAATRRTIIEAEGLGAMGGGDELDAIVDARSPPTTTPPRRSAAAT